MMVVRAREQQRSKTFRKGDNLDHDTAVVKTGFFFDRYKKNPDWMFDMNFHIDYPEKFIKEHKLRRSREHLEHNFDGCIRDGNYKILAFIEMNGNVGYWFEGKATGRHWKIANPTKHSKKLQQINDGINKAYAESIGAEYIVLLKEEINGDAKDPDREKNSFQELQRGLRDWIK